MKHVILRKATLKDVASLEAVGDHLFDYPIKKNRAVEFLEDPRHHLIIALIQDKVIGMISAIHYVHPDKDPMLFIIEAGVIDEFQNQGIGRTLVQEMVKYGKQMGCQDIWLGTEKANIQARKAYSAAGGQEENEPFILINF